MSTPSTRSPDGPEPPEPPDGHGDGPTFAAWALLLTLGLLAAAVAALWALGGL